MERRDSAVSPPWEVTWYEPEKPPEPLPAGTRIGDIFHQKRRQLLILGEPGAGKTTTMLELARELLDAAKEDNTQPIPVLVSLSSWKQPEVGIFDWLVAELKDKYGLRQDLGKEWLKNRLLLPLLDGLDEVTPVLQPQCAEAINTWLTGDIEKRPCGVLVCCRREEFEKIVGKKLSLQGAIYLQPLTAMQIEKYFDGLKLSDVWQTVGEDAALQELLAKPLFLSMFGLVRVEGKFDRAAWQKRETSAAKIEYLFDTYWDAVMSRELILEPGKQNAGWRSQTYKTKPLPQRKAVRRMLVFIAKGMERDSSIGTEFLIENMQPSWLPNRIKKIILYLAFGLSFCLILYLDFGLISGLIFGLGLGLIFINLKIRNVYKISILMSHEARKKILKKIGTNMIPGLIPGLFWGLSFGLSFGLFWGLILGLSFSLFWALVRGLVRGLIESSEVEI